MAKKNCWEFTKCGRQPKGERVQELGVCPAAVELKLEKVHGGGNAGRACWVVAGTLCGGKVQGSFARKYGNCEQCEFYQLVQLEEGPGFKHGTMLLKKLKFG
jgi:hypothetical protein